MLDRLKIVLFTEVNSKLGSPFLRVLSAHPLIELAAVVTSPKDARALCAYFINDEKQIDIEAEAKALGINVVRPRRVSSPEVIRMLTEIQPDYFIVANFQQLLSPALLAVPAIAAINFHPSPLPRYAGLAPFYWIVRNGERQSSISAIKMDEGLDTGPIVMQRQIQLREQETGLSLRTFQEEQNVLMLLDLIPSLASGSFACVPQDLSRRTYFGRPTSDDYLLDFRHSARHVLNQIRAGYRHPGAHFFLENGRRIVILTAALADDQGLGKPDVAGAIVHTSGGTFIAAMDDWLRLLTVEVQGVETPVSAVDLPGTFLESSEISVGNALAAKAEAQCWRSSSRTER